MSEPSSPADVALDRLREAHGQLRLASRLVDDMHAGLSRASSALVEAELESRRAGMIGEGPLSGLALTNAGQEMARVAMRCEDAAAVGHQIQVHLREASTAVQQAQVSVGQIERRELSIDHACDVAVLQARVEALAKVVELAGPIAAATTRHVEAAAEVARRNSTLNLDQRAQVGEVLRMGNGVAVASADLGRAAEADRHLDAVLTSASTSAHRATGDADVVSQAARRRMDQHRDASGAPVAMTGPSR